MQMAFPSQHIQNYTLPLLRKRKKKALIIEGGKKEETERTKTTKVCFVTFIFLLSARIFLFVAIFPHRSTFFLHRLPITSITPFSAQHFLAHMYVSERGEREEIGRGRREEGGISAPICSFSLPLS